MMSENGGVIYDVAGDCSTLLTIECVKEKDLLDSRLRGNDSKYLWNDYKAV